MFNKFLKLPTEQKALLVAAVVVIILGLFYHSYNYPQVYARMGAGVGRLRGSVNLEAMRDKCVVVLFYSKSCPHCVKIMDIKQYPDAAWAKFKALGTFKTEEIEHDNISKSKYGNNKPILEQINGYPTIMVLNKNDKGMIEPVIFPGNTKKKDEMTRTSENFAKFAQDNCK